MSKWYTKPQGGWSFSNSVLFNTGGSTNSLHYTGEGKTFLEDKTYLYRTKIKNLKNLPDNGLLLETPWGDNFTNDAILPSLSTDDGYINFYSKALFTVDSTNNPDTFTISATSSIDYSYISYIGTNFGDTKGIYKVEIKELEWDIQGYSWIEADGLTSGDALSTNNKGKGWSYNSYDDTDFFEYFNTTGGFNPVGFTSSVQSISGDFLEINHLTKYIDYSFFNLYFTPIIATGSGFKLYLSDEDPFLMTTTQSFIDWKSNSNLIGVYNSTATASAQSFVGLKGNKYISFVAENNLPSNFRLFDVKVEGGYGEGNNKLYEISATSSESLFDSGLSGVTFSSSIGQQQLITGGSSQVSQIFSKIGNGAFKSGMWENGVWNNGWRLDDSVREFDDIDLSIKLTSDVRWRFRIIGPSASVSNFSLGDEITIGNIVAIDINEKRRLIRDRFRIVALDSTGINNRTGYVVVELETTFPVRRIERDSKKHKIKITKNGWLSGAFLNGYFTGVWNYGLFKGYPLITEMDNTNWIDGIFEGGHFKSQYYINGLIDDVFSKNNKLGFITTEPHKLAVGDIIEVTMNNQSVNKDYNGEAIVTEVIDDNQFVTNKDYGIKVVSNSGGPVNISSIDFISVTFSNSESAGRICRLSSDLDPDNIFGSFNGVVRDVLIDSSKYLIVGDFTSYTPVNGVETTCLRIVRLNSDGTIDTSFIAGFNNSVRCIHKNGSDYYVGGDFTFYSNSSSTSNIIRIAKLNSIGQLDVTFRNNVMSASTNKGFNSSVNTIKSLSNIIYIGGSFTIFNGVTRNRIIAINQNGTRYDTFNIGSGFNNTVNIILVRSFQLIIGGDFTTYKGVPKNRIVSLNTTTGTVPGSINTTFDVGTGFNSGVKDMVIDINDLYVVGNFSTYKGVTSNRVIKLHATFGNMELSYNIPIIGILYTVLYSNSSLYIGGTFGVLKINGNSISNEINTQTVFKLSRSLTNLGSLSENPIIGGTFTFTKVIFTMTQESYTLVQSIENKLLSYTILSPSLDAGTYTTNNIETEAPDLLNFTISNIVSHWQLLQFSNIGISGIISDNINIIGKEGGQFTTEIANGLIQNMTFNSNNISKTTSIDSLNTSDVFVYNSWIDVNYSNESAVNIGRPQTKINEASRTSFSENNLYGYPTDDVLSSDSKFRDSYTLTVRNYKLGNKWKLFNDYVGDSSKFTEYFGTSSEDTQLFLNQGWTFSKYAGISDSITFSRTNDLGIRDITGEELRVEAMNNGGVLNLSDPIENINNRNIEKIEKSRYTIIEFDLVTYSVPTTATQSGGIFKPFIHFDNINTTKRVTNSTTIDLPSQYLPIYVNVEHTKTKKRKKVEYFFNKRNLSMNFTGGTSSKSDYILNNLKVYEVDMIPFFQYFIDININKSVQIPLQGIAPYIDFENSDFTFIDSINVGLNSISVESTSELVSGVGQGIVSGGVTNPVTPIKTPVTGTGNTSGETTGGTTGGSSGGVFVITDINEP